MAENGLGVKCSYVLRCTWIWKCYSTASTFWKNNHTISKLDADHVSKIRTSSDFRHLLTIERTKNFKWQGFYSIQHNTVRVWNPNYRKRPKTKIVWYTDVWSSNFCWFGFQTVLISGLNFHSWNCSDFERLIWNWTFKIRTKTDFRIRKYNAKPVWNQFHIRKCGLEVVPNQLFSGRLKSEQNHSDFRRCPKVEVFDNLTKISSAEIRTFGRLLYIQVIVIWLLNDSDFGHCLKTQLSKTGC